MKRTGTWCGLALAGLALSGCASLNFQSRLQEVSILVARDANHNAPVALDLVLLSDQKMYDRLAQLRATEWFAGKADYLRQAADTITVLSWEVVPGQQLDNLAVPKRGATALGALVFADYAGNSAYQARIQNQKKVTIYLMQQDFEIIAK